MMRARRPRRCRPVRSFSSGSATTATARRSSWRCTRAGVPASSPQISSGRRRRTRWRTPEERAAGLGKASMRVASRSSSWVPRSVVSATTRRRTPNSSEMPSRWTPHSGTRSARSRPRVRPRRRRSRRRRPASRSRWLRSKINLKKVPGRRLDPRVLPGVSSCGAHRAAGAAAWLGASPGPSATTTRPSRRSCTSPAGPCTDRAAATRERPSPR
mmetsp:Transcript_6003/g.26900  ORF Transcript_6003/g.26900 Transcript_6003/m.26900 type:complete len:214 (+) Transcript_6003:2202-2843(+)